jgi:hypothetical protein
MEVNCGAMFSDAWVVRLGGYSSYHLQSIYIFELEIGHQKFPKLFVSVA